MGIILSVIILGTSYSFMAIICSLIAVYAYGWNYEPDGIFDKITLLPFRVIRFVLREKNVPNIWSNVL